MLRGTIIWAEIDDGHGNTKPRPALVLSSDEAIDEGEVLTVAAISTVFNRPVPSHWFALPSNPCGDAITGLDQPSVVKSDWLRNIEQTSVIKEMGRAPAEIVKQVINFLKERNRQQK